MTRTEAPRALRTALLAMSLVLTASIASSLAAAQQAEDPLERWRRIQLERQKHSEQQWREVCEKQKAASGAYPAGCPQAATENTAGGETKGTVAATPPAPQASHAAEPSMPEEAGRYAATLSPWSEPPDGPLEEAAGFSGRAVAFVDENRRELTELYFCPGDRPFSATALFEVRGWTEALGPGTVEISGNVLPDAVSVRAQSLYGWLRNRGGSLRLDSFGPDELTGAVELALYGASNAPAKLRGKTLAWRAAFRAVRVDRAELSTGFKTCP